MREGEREKKSQILLWTLCKFQIFTCVWSLKRRFDALSLSRFSLRKYRDYLLFSHFQKYYYHHHKQMFGIVANFGRASVPVAQRAGSHLKINAIRINMGTRVIFCRCFCSLSPISFCVFVTTWIHWPFISPICLSISQ